MTIMSWWTGLQLHTLSLIHTETHTHLYKCQIKSLQLMSRATLVHKQTFASPPSPRGGRWPAGHPSHCLPSVLLKGGVFHSVLLFSVLYCTVLYCRKQQVSNSDQQTWPAHLWILVVTLGDLVVGYVHKTHLGLFISRFTGENLWAKKTPKQTCKITTKPCLTVKQSFNL